MCERAPDKYRHLRVLTDADFWWSYRVIGYEGTTVIFNESVQHCSHPPTESDLRSIELSHERATAYGARTSTTMGPFRARRKDQT